MGQNGNALVRVVLTQRVHDFHAALQGRDGIWGTGGNAAEAIGQMVFAHPLVFGVEIDQSGALPHAKSHAAARA
jgi:hypothetical protein